LIRYLESSGISDRPKKKQKGSLSNWRKGNSRNSRSEKARGKNSNDHIQKLNDLLEEARKCVEQGRSRRDQFIEIDKQIHMNLAQIAGNPIYTSILHSIHENIHRYYERFLSMEERELEENYQDLCNIVRTVEDGNAGEARKFAQEHVQRFNRYMKKREQNEGD